MVKPYPKAKLYPMVKPYSRVKPYSMSRPYSCVLMATRYDLILLTLSFFLAALATTSLLRATSAWQDAPHIVRPITIPSSTTDGPQTAAQRERVAVCVAGSVRTFRYNLTHRNILRRIVQPLRRDYAVDVFFLVRMGDATVRDNLRSAIKDDNATLRAIALFDAVNVTLVTDDLPSSRIRHPTVNGLAEFIPPARCSLPDDAASRVPDALYRSKQCLRMIEHHERQHARRFDWVYRIRPDVILFDDVLLPSQLQRDTLYSNQGRPNVTTRLGLWWRRTRLSPFAGYGPVADQMAISSRKVAQVALRAFDATDECELYSVPGRIAPEEILRFWLLLNRVRYAAVPFDWAIVREFVGPECKRLFWQHGDGTDWKQSIARCLKVGANYANTFPKSNFKRRLERLQNKTRLPVSVMTW